MNGIVTWSPGMSLASIEKLIILEAYHFFRGNKSATSSSLGIAVRTLDNKLEQYEKETLDQQERDANELRKRELQLARARGQLPDNLNFIPQPSSRPAPSGLGLESIINTTAQPALPMSERTEVQAVLSKHAAQSHKAKGR